MGKAAIADFVNRNCQKASCLMCKEADKYKTYNDCPLLALKQIGRERKLQPQDVPDKVESMVHGGTKRQS